jgi:hypothetical protein
MNPYLAKLRALEAKRPLPADVAGFVSFVSAQSNPIPESAIPHGGRAPDHPRPAADPENLERRHLREPTKLTKPPSGGVMIGFVGFVGVQSRPISKFEIQKAPYLRTDKTDKTHPNSSSPCIMSWMFSMAAAPTTSRRSVGGARSKMAGASSRPGARVRKPLGGRRATSSACTHPPRGLTRATVDCLAMTPRG